MRSAPNDQKIASKITAPRAMAPSSAASPSRPITAAPTKPSIGVVTLAIVMGSARARTRRFVGRAELATVCIMPHAKKPRPPRKAG